jgi:ketosteroid isomerase-like protein
VGNPEGLDLQELAVTVARRNLERWNARELDAVYRDLDPEIVVRPDPSFPDAGELVGKEAARGFWQDKRDFAGYGQVEILEAHDLGDRCLMCVRQRVDASSWVRNSFDWSFLTTVRAGRIVLVEFFVDRDRGISAAGLVGPGS